MPQQWAAGDRRGHWRVLGVAYKEDVLKDRVKAKFMTALGHGGCCCLTGQQQGPESRGPFCTLSCFPAPEAQRVLLPRGWGWTRRQRDITINNDNSMVKTVAFVAHSLCSASALSTSRVSTQWITAAQWGTFWTCLHFMDEDAEAQRGRVTCPRTRC